jgi:hypothetical protein
MAAKKRRSELMKGNVTDASTKRFLEIKQQKEAEQVRVVEVEQPLVEKAQTEEESTEYRPTRTAKWMWLDTDGGYGVLRITDNGFCGNYLVQQIGIDLYLLTRLGMRGTTTFVTALGKAQQCGCVSWNQEEGCNHLLALTVVGKQLG